MNTLSSEVRAELYMELSGVVDHTTNFINQVTDERDAGNVSDESFFFVWIGVKQIANLIQALSRGIEVNFDLPIQVSELPDLDLVAPPNTPND